MYVWIAIIRSVPRVLEQGINKYTGSLERLQVPYAECRKVKDDRTIFDHMSSPGKRFCKDEMKRSSGWCRQMDKHVEIAQAGMPAK